MQRSPLLFYLCISAISLFRVFIGIPCSSAQSIQVERLSTDGGLAHNFVESLYEDSRGFLWIGTRNGLQRYDGYILKTYIRNVSIKGVAENSKGDIFFVTVDGAVHKLTLSSSGFRHSIYLKAKEAVSIKHVAIDHADRIWIAHLKGLYIIHPDTHRTDIRELENLQVHSTLPEDSGGTVYACSNNGLFAISNEGSGYRIKTLSGVMETFNISPKDSRKKMWFVSSSSPGKPKQFCCLDSTDKTYFISPFPHPIPWWSLIVNDHLYTSSNGISEINVRTGKVTPLDIRDRDGHKLTFFSFSYCHTRSGILWLGTDNGIVKVDLNKQQIYNTYIDESFPVHLRSINETGKDTFVAGTYEKGLFRIINKVRTDHRMEKTAWDNLKNFVFSDSKRNIWVGAQGNLRKYDVSFKLLHIYPIQFAWDIYEDKDQKYWIATSRNELVLLDDNTGKHTVFRLRNSRSDRIYIWNIHTFGDLLLLATSDGFHYFNRLTQQFDTGWPPGNKIKQEVKHKIWQIMVDDDKLYITGEGAGAGIKIADRIKHNIETYTYDDHNFYGFEADRFNNLWIVTEGGIMRFNTRTHRFRLYSSKDGFITNNFSFHGHAKRLNGQLIFAGEHGFSCFDPASLLRRNIPLHTRITSFRIAGVEQADYLENGQQLELEHNRNFISFDFASGDFQGIVDNHYAYMLMGVDNDWNNSGDRHFASYPNLAPGSYTFLVKALNADGYWGEPTSIHIRIIPPLWGRAWFITLIILLVVLITSGVVIYVIRNLKKEHTYQKATLQSEINALRSQINPHFIFNALNAIQHFIIKNEKREANLFLSRFASLIRNILDYSSLQTISVREEVTLLSNYLEIEKLRFEEKLSWEILTDPAMDPEAHIPTLLIQPVVENAVIHGITPKVEGGHISISFIAHNSYIICKVTDNGAGRSASAKHNYKSHRSKGTDLLVQRIEHINKVHNARGSILFRDLTDSNGIAMGTEVTITLPSL